jgi:hypothetical protein
MSLALLLPPTTSQAPELALNSPHQLLYASSVVSLSSAGATQLHVASNYETKLHKINFEADFHKLNASQAKRIRLDRVEIPLSRDLSFASSVHKNNQQTVLESSKFSFAQQSTENFSSFE